MTLMATLRTFIALELSDEAAAALGQVQNRLKKLVPAGSVRWTAPDSIHLTLHFLGDVDPGQVEPIRRQIEASAAICPPFSLALAGLGCFPNTRRPRIVWIGVTGQTAPLLLVQRDLGERLKQGIGFKPEDRPYSPHLTIGRVKDNLPPGELTRLGQALSQVEVAEIGRIDVTEVALMKSDLGSSGAVYTRLAAGRLGGKSKAAG